MPRLSSEAGADRNTWEVVVPVSDATPAPPLSHGRMGQPTARWEYPDESGALLGYVCRFDGLNGKSFAPLTWCRHRENEKTAWRWKAWPVPRPLYGLDRLAARHNASVVLTEGEKAADAAGRLLSDWVAVTSPNGSRSAAKADWAPLAGRRVTIWPDADDAGLRYAADAARCLASVGAEVTVVDPPTDVAAGWDAADALAGGWDTARTLALIEEAKPPTGSSSAAHATAKGGATSKRPTPPGPRDQLLGLVRDVELWHSPDRVGYASVPVREHVENYPIDSDDFRWVMLGRFYVGTGGAPAKQTLEDALRVLEARALHDGGCYPVWRRVAGDDREIYLDLCDTQWQAVRITAHGWDLSRRHPVKFVRSPGMLALPESETGELIQSLRDFINLSRDEDFLLVVSWLVAALRPTGPYPILDISGEQGAGKSFATRMLRALVDPNVSPCRSMPYTERDLMVTAYHSWLLTFDNISTIKAVMSDALCRLSTGGGLATRKLHTDQDEVILDAQRPILVNGIPDLAGRPDLSDRMLSVSLAAIDEHERKLEAVLWDEFEQRRPGILGALCDAVSMALCQWPEMIASPPKNLPRLTDFALWIEAAAPALGWESGAFLEAYRGNRAAAVLETLADDPVAVEVQRFVEEGGAWEGSAGDLLERLSLRIDDRLRTSKRWPQSAQSLGMALSRLATVLRRGAGIVAVKGRDPTPDRKRFWSLSRSGLSNGEPDQSR